jgi:hypothetical protein
MEKFNQESLEYIEDKIISKNLELKSKINNELNFKEKLN